MGGGSDTGVWLLPLPLPLLLWLPAVVFGVALGFELLSSSPPRKMLPAAVGDPKEGETPSPLLLLACPVEVEGPAVRLRSKSAAWSCDMCSSTRRPSALSRLSMRLTLASSSALMRVRLPGVCRFR